MTDRRSQIETRQGSSTPEATGDQLNHARERFADDWLALRQSLRLETGAEPRWSANLIWPVMALAAGMAVGAGVWWRRSRRD